MGAIRLLGMILCPRNRDYSRGSSQFDKKLMENQDRTDFSIATARLPDLLDDPTIHLGCEEIIGFQGRMPLILFGLSVEAVLNYNIGE